jgi:signal transduction histidine kinase
VKQKRQSTSGSTPRNKALINFGGEAILLVDQELKILQANKAASVLIGIPPKKLPETVLTELLEPAEKAKFELKRRQLLTKHVTQGTLRLKRRDDSLIHLRFSGVMIGKRLYQFVLHDGLEGHQREQDLIRRNKEALALYEIGKQIATLVDLDQILMSIVKNILWLLECQVAGIAISDAHAGQFTFRAMVGNRQQWTIPESHNSIGRILQTLGVAVDPAVIQTSPGAGELDIREFPLFAAENLASVLAVPLRYKGILFGALVAGYRSKHEFAVIERQLVTNLANQSAVAIESSRLHQATIEHSRTMELLSARFVKIQEEERRRISRELHDSVGQALTALHLNLDVLNTENSSISDDSRERIRNMKMIVDETLRDIRQIAYELRPAILDDFGIIPALRLFVHRFARQTGIEATIDVPSKLPRRVPGVEATIYRVVQEALSNVAQHSRATRVTVRLTATDASLSLDISDNGIGFNSEHFEHPQNQYSGLGLLSMKERIFELNGSSFFRSSEGEGTSLHFEIPLNQ